MLTLIHEQSENDLRLYQTRCWRISRKIKTRLLSSHSVRNSRQRYKYIEGFIRGLTTYRNFEARIKSARKLSNREKQLLMTYWKLAITGYDETKKPKLEIISKPVEFDWYTILSKRIKNHMVREKQRAKDRARRNSGRPSGRRLW